MSNIKLGIYAKHKIKDIYILFYHKKNVRRNKNYKRITKDRKTNDDLNIGFCNNMISFFNIFVVRMLWCNGPCILGKEMLAWQGRLWTDTLKHMAYSLNLHAPDHRTSSWELGKHTSPSTVNPSRKTLLPELKASNARLVLLLVTFSFFFSVLHQTIFQLYQHYFELYFYLINLLKHFD